MEDAINFWKLQAALTLVGGQQGLWNLAPPNPMMLRPRNHHLPADISDMQARVAKEARVERDLFSDI